jgi:hypothetical protein
MPDPTEIDAALRRGLLPNQDAVMMIRHSRVEEGSARGSRAIDIRVWDGIDLRILPDRGFDIGPAWYRGAPLAWVSQVGETGPLDDPRDFDWALAFGGGLMVTCGLRNVGMPSEGHGLHGTFSHLPAAGVAVSRLVSEEGSHVLAEAVIEDVGNDHHLRVERSIRTHVSKGVVEVTDSTTNLGTTPVEAPILYHFNLGYPLWSEGARVRIDASETIARDEPSRASLGSWAEPPPVHQSEERVLEHRVVPHGGWGSAGLVNEAMGIEVSIRWRLAELPRLHQWVNPSPGMCVLGLEPANCSTSGRAHDRASGELPYLQPGENRETSLVVEARFP